MGLEFLLNMLLHLHLWHCPDVRGGQTIAFDTLCELPLCAVGAVE